MRNERAPVCLRPQFLGAARRVQQDGIRLLRNHRCRGGWNDMPMRRPVDRVSERRGRKPPAALDKMQIARHAMVYVMCERRERFTNALPIETMPAATSGSGNQSALDLLLQIENSVVALHSEIAADRAG